MCACVAEGHARAFASRPWGAGGAGGEGVATHRGRRQDAVRRLLHFLLLLRARVRACESRPRRGAGNRGARATRPWGAGGAGGEGVATHLGRRQDAVRRLLHFLLLLRACVRACV